MKRLPQILLICMLLLVSAAHSGAQQQASVAIFPFGSLSSGDRWITTGLPRDLVEKLIRTPELRPVPLDRIDEQLAAVVPKKSKGPAWLAPSVQRKVGQWLEADLILTGAVGASNSRGSARDFLGGLSIVPSVTPEGSEVWIAAQLIDVHRGVAVSWAFAEGSREGFFELQAAIYLQIISDLGIDPGTMPRGTVGRPTEFSAAYKTTLEAEDLLLEERETKHHEKQWRRAIKKLEKSLKIDPSYAKTYTLLGRAYQRQGQLDGALAAFGQSSALDPNYVEPRMAIADFAKMAGDTPAEMRALDSVLEAASWDDTALDRMGQAHERLGQTERAAHYYDRAIRLSDGEPDRLYRAGSVKVSLGEFDKAIEYLDRAVARLPGESPYHVMLTRAYTRAGYLDQAQATLQTAVNIGVESTDLWLAAGELALEKKDYAAAESAFAHVLELQPGRMDARLMVARLRVLRGDHHAAIEAYNAAIADGIPLEDIVEPLAKAFAGAGEKDKAEELYRKALSNQPDNVDWLLARSRILIESMRHAEAIPPLRRLRELHLDHLDATEWLAGAYAVVGNDAEAIRLYRALLVSSPELSHVYVRLGELNYRVRNFESARNAYEDAISAGLGTSDVYAGLGLSEEELRRYRSARTAYQNALDRDRTNAIARAGLQRMRSKIRTPRREPSAAEWAQRGHNRMDSGDIEGAINAFERSIAKRGNNARVLNDLGLAYAMIGDTGRARIAFEKAEQADPSTETAYNLGRLSFQEGKPSEAMLNYQIVLQRDATFLTAALNLSALQASAGDAGSAIQTLSDIREHYPESGAVTISLANAYFQSDELDRAARLYREATGIANAAADAHIGLGNVSLCQGDTTSAADHYQQAIASAPDNPDARVNLGTVLIQQGRYDEAVLEFQRALELNPSDLALYLNLAVLYYHTEQYPESLEYCRAVIEQDASVVEAQRLIGDIAMATEEYQLAVDAYGAVLLQDSGDLSAILGVAEAYVALEQPEMARDYWQQWLDLIGEDPAYESQTSAISRRLNGEENAAATWFYEQIKELRSLTESL